MINLFLQMMESEVLKNLFLKLVNMSISASWIVLVVLILRLVLKKAPKWVPVLLWGIVAVRLICPFSFESALSLIPSAETIPMNIEMDATPAIDSGISAVNIVVNPMIAASFTPSPMASANPLQIWIPLAAVIWFFGMVLMPLYTAISYWCLRRKVETAVLYKDNIFQSENVDSPFVLGILKPRIYLPFTVNKQDLDHVVAHEQAHICRKDHWWKPLGFLLLTIHWFNPLIWLAYVQLCRDIELACDEKVIKKLDNEKRADYTQALVSCSVNHRMIAACPLAFGEVGVKDRVKSIMNYRKPTFWIIGTALMVCVVVAVCFLTDPNPSREFSMKGNNVYSLDPEAVLERILDTEDCESGNVYMNSFNCSLHVDSDFNWMGSQTVPYFFSNAQKTYSAQLRIFPEEGKYFLTEPTEWHEQEHVFLLQYFLEAIKYLPQYEIQQIAPADQYIISHIESGRPSDFERVITYTSEGVKEIEGWYLHLQIQPLHVDGEQYHGTGGEVVELFYGHNEQSDSSDIIDPKLFEDNNDDILGTISSIQNMEPVRTQNGDILILQNEGGLWRFTEGQQVDISVMFENDGSSMSMKSIGYIYCGDGDEGMYVKEIFSDQNTEISTGRFTVPETGNYLFYFRNYSASWIKLNTFDVEYGSSFQAKVLEIVDSYFLVEPVEGSWELKSADKIEIPMKNMNPSPEPQVGDILQIEYDGKIQEIYPARINNPYSIKVVEEVEIVNSDILNVFKNSISSDETIIVTDYVYADDEAYGLNGVVQYADETGSPWKLAFIRDGVVHPVSQDWGTDYIMASELTYLGNGTVQVYVENTNDSIFYECTISFSYDAESGNTNFKSESKEVEMPRETMELMIDPVAPVSIVNLISGEERIITSNADIRTIQLLTSSEWWAEGNPACDNDFKITINGESYWYHSDCGTLNDIYNDKCISLDESKREEINRIFGVTQDLEFDNFYLTIGTEGVKSIEVTMPNSSGGCENADGSLFKKGDRIWLECLDGYNDLRGVSITALSENGEIIWTASIPNTEGNIGFTHLRNDDWDITNLP